MMLSMEYKIYALRHVPRLIGCNVQIIYKVYILHFVVVTPVSGIIFFSISSSVCNLLDHGPYFNAKTYKFSHTWLLAFSQVLKLFLGYFKDKLMHESNNCYLYVILINDVYYLLYPPQLLGST